jgi:hypothetical protein
MNSGPLPQEIEHGIVNKSEVVFRYNPQQKEEMF